jgi:hypothetical protein
MWLRKHKGTKIGPRLANTRNLFNKEGRKREKTEQVPSF